ncbi:OmpA family protein [Geodermatophilus obscurus]|uniref:OmpA family protein n=1 Tax=Geodermatophilus obscurus TaxID=1861 RepID=UPI000942992B|nr:OmpA family protein [Geodermatophilus obscurus]
MRRLLTVAVSAALVAGLTGCGSDDVAEPTGGVAFVVGARSNMPAPQLDGGALEVLDAAVDDQSRVSITVADGEPSLVEPGAIDLLIEGATSQARDASRVENRQLVLDGLVSARAEDKETDLLGALDEAVRSISSAPGPHTVVVVDSGLSTAGALDFRARDVLSADPKALADQLAADDELPDLKGSTVVFQGLGDTFSPQMPLGRPQRQDLIDIWAAIAERAGAADVVVEESRLLVPPVGVLPKVTPVEVPDGAACTVTLTSDLVRFKPDSAEFLDRAATLEVLAPLAAQLTQPGVSATLTGTTARVGDMAGQVELSLSRAEAVRSLLTDEFESPSDAMAAIGLGSDFPEYVEDHGPDGELDEDKAAQNRRVVVQLVGGAGLTCG